MKPFFLCVRVPLRGGVRKLLIYSFAHEKVERERRAVLGGEA